MSKGLEVVFEVVMALFLMKILGENVFMYLGVDIPNHNLVSPCRDYCLAISKPENMTLLRMGVSFKSEKPLSSSGIPNSHGPVIR